MAQAARAYDYYSTAAPQRAPRRQQQPDVRVLPGRNADVATLSPALVKGFKVALVAIMVLVAICGVRVWLSASTVGVLQNVETLQSNIETANATGDELEIKHAALASTTRIETKAKDLDMGTPSKTTYITVSLPAKVATNADGSISIASTIENIENANASSGK